MGNSGFIIAIVFGVLLVTTLIISFISLARAQRTTRRIEANTAKMDAYFTTYAEMVERNQRSISEQQEFRLRNIEEGMARLRNENTSQLDNMRQTVDERLEQVFRGLGEMQSVAANVGDLKKILSNVKTRGILGEVQLAAILEQILNNDQYDENVATVPGSDKRVEFAIKLPGDGENIVYLPIDSKFPADTYSSLMDAYETGDKAIVDRFKTALRNAFRKEAKDIRDKYISPPHTTDFGIMFLPFEGLYAEAVNMGVIELLQREYKVTVAGPTTMAALLNSLQMGFHTLAIEKRSSEVWKILAEVKTEFAKFDAGLKDARKRIRQADDELDKLEGVRTRAINRKLRDVMLLDDDGEENEDICDSGFTSIVQREYK
ncbi:MAG TPA: DNA recombination protein RmuC [Mogibacterium sp.]|nr:DNA recombination protein RmuC [Mogibacterium sp.]